MQEDQTNPVRRDTVTIPPGGSVTLRWIADNPGAVSDLKIKAYHSLPLGPVSLSCQYRAIGRCCAADEIGRLAYVVWSGGCLYRGSREDARGQYDCPSGLP
jgi:hypothetical protein